MLTPPPPLFWLIWAPSSPLYCPESPPSHLHHPSFLLGPLDLPILGSSTKCKFRIMPSLTWALPRSGVSLPPVLVEVKENIPPSCQRARVHNPHQCLRMRFKTLWKDTCKEFSKEEARELFRGMMSKSFSNPCSTCQNGGWCVDYQVCADLLPAHGGDSF